MYVNTRVNKIIGTICLLAASSLLNASETMLQPRMLIDAHTAGVLPKASFDFQTRIYPSGDTTISGSGLGLAISVGLTDRLTIGISYGGDGLIGRGVAKPNPFPGGLIKYRLIEETFALPAIAIGYDHQGYGGIMDENVYKGYVYKSPGFFAAASKNYLIFSTMQLGFHGGINFSLEEYKEIHWPNGYFGIDLGINEELAIIAEYDAALNEQDRYAEKKSYANPLRGYLNLGIRWAFTPSLFIEAAAKDLLQNKLSANANPLNWSREFKLVYVTHF